MAFFYGWKKILPFRISASSSDTFVSVIIAVRNEADNVEFLISDLILQEYPDEKFEIIFVDDSSSDNTCDNIKKFTQKVHHISLHSLSSDLSGKKAAISFALQKAKGKLIVATDGDCRMGKKWLSSIVSFYDLYKPKMIIAPVLFHKEKNIFETVQSLEFSSLIASGAGAVGINRPFICNAANLAYEKNISEEFSKSMNPDFASGDDVFLLHNLKKTNRNDILFLKSVDAIVYTKPQSDIISFVSQRIRWSAKSKGYSDADTVVTALLTYLVNLMIVTSCIVGFFNTNFFFLCGAMLILKTIIEMFFLHSFLSFFKKQKLLIWFVPLQLIYFVYVSLIGIFGLFLKVSWKGRKI